MHIKLLTMLVDLPIVILDSVVLTVVSASQKGRPYSKRQIFVIPPGFTGLHISLLDVAHKIQIRIWKEYLAVDKSWKQ